MTNKTLDPYTAKAENDNLSPQEKIEGLHTIVKSVKTGMLTTRIAEGHLHSRAMAPAGRKCPSIAHIVTEPDTVYNSIQSDASDARLHRQ